MTKLRVTRKGFKIATIEGVKYMIPISSEPLNYFDGLEIGVLSQFHPDEDEYIRITADTNQDEYTLKLNNEDERGIAITNLSLINIKENCQDDGKIIIALYRENNPKPISVLKHFAYEPLLGNNFLFESYEKSFVQQGKYFLLYANVAPVKEFSNKFKCYENCYIILFNIDRN